jgi:hypothetical protein
MGILVSLVALTNQDLQSPLATAPDIVLETVPRAESDRAVGAELSGCATAVAIRATTGGMATSTPTADGTGSAVCADVDMVTQVLAGADRLGELDQAVWNRLAVVPLAEPTVALALGPALGSVTLPADPLGVLWGGGLRNLGEWTPPE